jgi:hypothetical protein
VSQVGRDANVYFLPPPGAAAAAAPVAPTWRRLRARIREELWRVRFAVAGFRSAMRRPRRPVLDADEPVLFGARRAQFIDRRPRLAPARVIDFDSARARLRPLTAAR